jgi:hypothetical protein
MNGRGLRPISRLQPISLVLLVAACAGSAPAGGSLPPSASSASPLAPSAEPSASDVPAATPSVPLETPTATSDVAPAGDGSSVWAQRPPEPLLLGTYVRVVVAELNMREAPTTSAKRVDTFAADQVIIVRDVIPPVEADGYVWYVGSGPFRNVDGQLPPLPYPAGADIDTTEGWFAARRGATLFVKPVDARCPSDVGIVDLGAMAPAERLACFGDRTIEFEGAFRAGCPTCEHFGTFEPAWLANPNEYNYVADTGTGVHGPGLNVRFPPGLAVPENGSIVSVRGHFDDPAAGTCSLAMVPWDYRDMEVDPAPQSVAQLWCRHQFAAETIDVIGTDPTYEGF